MIDQALCRTSNVSTTFDPMRVHQPRGQLWAFVYLAARHLLGMVVLLFRSERPSEIELPASMVLG
jgi:hypothetical protein